MRRVFCLFAVGTLEALEKFYHSRGNDARIPILYDQKNFHHHHHQQRQSPEFIWHIWIPLKKICNATRRVCVCIVLVHYGPFPQEVNEKSVKLAVWAVSLNFLHDFTLFVVDIHQIRLISLFRHFSDHFHFHPILEQKRVIDLNPCHMIWYEFELWFFWAMSIAHRAMSISYIELNPMYELWSYHDNSSWHDHSSYYEHSS